MNDIKWTMEMIVDANFKSGQKWFDDKVMIYFKSRVKSQVFQGECGVFFTTSEKGPFKPRRHTIRQFFPETGKIDTVGAFCELTEDDALQQCKFRATINWGKN